MGRMSAVGAGLVGAALLLAACGQSQTKSGDKFAGLSEEMRTWRVSILETSRLCQDDQHKCEGFEVVCKGEHALTAADRSQGVTAHVVAAMRYAGYDPQMKQPQDGTVTAAFRKTEAGWTRIERAPVNLVTCGDLAPA